MPRIVIVDQETRVHEALTSVLEPMGHKVRAFRTPALAAVQLRQEPPEIVIAEAENGGINLIEELREAELSTVVMLTCSLPKKDLALAALRAGAYDMFIKPLNVRDFVKSINRALSGEGGAEGGGADALPPVQPLCLVGESAAAKSLRKQADAVVRAGGRSPVLIQGPQGAGKREMVRHLHGLLKSASAPFVVISCADLDERELRQRLLEGDDRPGPAFSEASGGTLVLEAVDRLAEPLQEAIAPLIKPASKDLWIVSTSGSDLDEALAGGGFSVKFYFQISSKVVELPALKNRLEDMGTLVEEILLRSSQIPDSARSLSFEPEAVERLCAQEWGENLASLEQVVIAAVRDNPGRAVREADLVRPLRSLRGA